MSDQRLTALNLANKLRSAKADAKRAFRAGTLSPAVVALSTDLPFTVRELLQATPRIGSVKALRVCRELDLDSTSRLVDLSKADRAALADALASHIEHAKPLATSRAPLTPEALAQRSSRLAHANELRLAIAAVKRDVASGTIDAAEVARSTTLPLTVEGLLHALPRVGGKRVPQLCQALGIDPQRLIASLPPARRKALARAIETYSTARITKPGHALTSALQVADQTRPFLQLR